MRGIAVFPGAVLLVVAAVAAGFAQGAPRSARDGIYTRAQADRGHVVFEQECARCHGSDLGGSDGLEVPALIADAFETRWADGSVAELVGKITRGMPADRPATLRPEQVAELVAYILQQNRYPPGATELPTAAPSGLIIGRDR